MARKHSELAYIVMRTEYGRVHFMMDTVSRWRRWAIAAFLRDWHGAVGGECDWKNARKNGFSVVKVKVTEHG